MKRSDSLAENVCCLEFEFLSEHFVSFQLPLGSPGFLHPADLSTCRALGPRWILFLTLHRSDTQCCLRTLYTVSASTISICDEAQSLHVYTLRPALFLSTLHSGRYLPACKTRYKAPYGLPWQHHLEIHPKIAAGRKRLMLPSAHIHQYRKIFG